MKMQELLAEPAHWTKGEYARNNEDKRVRMGDPAATKFCLVGAIHRCYPESVERCKVIDKLRRAVADPFQQTGAEIESISLTVYNDHPARTHADILRLLKLADV